MRDEVAKLLFDMQVACERVTTFCQGCTEHDLTGDTMLRSAVERQLITVGEALFAASKYDPNWKDLVQSATDIVRLRHILVHGYDRVQPERLWQLVCTDVPALAAELRSLLAQASPTDESGT